MSGITLVSANPSLESSLVELYGKSSAVRRVWSDQWRDPVETTMDVCAADPELLVIGSDMTSEAVRTLIPAVDRRFPGTTIVALVQTRDTDYAMDLLRLGARDVLDESTAAEEFRAEIDRVLEVAKIRRERTSHSDTALRRRVITVLSPKGGTGKTTLATNLGVGLARRMPNQVLLLDLDTQFGDCAPSLGLQPEHSLIQAMASPSHERSALKVFVTQHRSGLAVLAPPEDLAAADDIDADRLKPTIAALTEEYPFVVIDTAGGIDSACLAAMELSTDLLLVSTTDVPAIRALRRQLDALDQVGFVSQRRSFVLNRSNAKVGLSVADVEAAVGLETSFQIPSTRIIPVSTNEGVPVIEKEGGNVARKLEDIVDYYAPRQDDSSRTFLRALRKER
ncbi:MAG: AAA family ATPase [Acidimicrobiia bacterium]|nr:AAA family ATPase [Acidimicrobiia bacterium]